MCAIKKNSVCDSLLAWIWVQVNRVVSPL